MKSRIASKIIAETPKHIEIFTEKYSDIVVRIHQLIKDQGLTQKILADKLEKKPSEISKWLSGSHNLTLRSIAKLEAELGEDIIHIPRRVPFFTTHQKTSLVTMYKNDTKREEEMPSEWTTPSINISKPFANAS
jgi:transcriptional regulator with XRE-family HTH domain